MSFATAQATVHHDPSVTVEELVGAVEASGYRARLADHATPRKNATT